MMYTVYESGKPCKFPEHKVDPSWNNATFETLEEAIQYADNWLGIYGPFHIDSDVNGILVCNYQQDCTIEIKPS